MVRGYISSVLAPKARHSAGAFSSTDYYVLSPDGLPPVARGLASGRQSAKQATSTSDASR